jgi:hypothetical protein
MKYKNERREPFQQVCDSAVYGDEANINPGVK